MDSINDIPNTIFEILSLPYANAFQTNFLFELSQDLCVGEETFYFLQSLERGSRYRSHISRTVCSLTSLIVWALTFLCRHFVFFHFPCRFLRWVATYDLHQIIIILISSSLSLCLLQIQCIPYLSMRACFLLRRYVRFVKFRTREKHRINTSPPDVTFFPYYICFSSVKRMSKRNK